MLIKGKVFFIYVDEFLIYRLVEFDNIQEADDFILELLEEHPKNQIVYKNFSFGKIKDIEDKSA